MDKNKYDLMMQQSFVGNCIFLHISNPQILFKSRHIGETIQESWAWLCQADVKESWQSNTNLEQLDRQDIF